jgi:dimethylpropiothetin dethiomethylase
MDEFQSDPDSRSRLNHFSDLHYLVHELYDLYRFRSVGGCTIIRSHQKEVRHRLSRLSSDEPPVHKGKVEGSEKPVCAHLSRAHDIGTAYSTASVSRAIVRIRDQLIWEYGYGKVPAGLSSKYIYLCRISRTQRAYRFD